MKRAQGLPLNTIVLAVIAVIVLVLVVMFATGGLPKLFGGISTIGPVNDLGTAQVACQTACNSLKVSASEAMFRSSNYCTKTYTIDLNSNGKIETASPRETGIPCWNEKRGTRGPTSISVRCTIQTDAGAVLTEAINCPAFHTTRNGYTTG